jgi:transposase InsO family protein
MIHEAPKSGRGLSVRQRCAVLSFSRATYYRLRAQHARKEEDTALCRHLPRLAVAWPAYGYRRLTHALHRQGLSVNHKRVLRLMREEHLVRRRRSRVARTTDSLNMAFRSIRICSRL